MSEVAAGLAESIAEWVLIMMRDHGIVVGLLATIGLFSIISAAGEKAVRAMGILFKLFIATPLIVVVGLINKSNRKQRLKELGEIKAYVKETPEKGKRILYYTILTIFVLFILSVVGYFLSVIVPPLLTINDFSKEVLQNSSNFT